MMKKILYLLLTTLILGVGCKKATTDDDYTGVATRIEMDVPVIVEHVTKASEKSVANVWVVQLKGEDVQKTSYVTTIEVVGGKYYFDVILKEGTDAIYVVANIGDDTFYQGVTTKTDFLAKELPVTCSANGTDLPMYGEIASPQQGNLNRVLMKYLVSKVRLRVRTDNIVPGSTFTPTSMKLCKAPKMASLVEQTLFPGTDASKFDAEIASANASEGVWYMAENKRGKGTAAFPSKKALATAPAGQGSYCTYVEVKGSFQKDAEAPITVYYKIWLGEDNISDYNVVRGVFYDVEMSIRDADLADSRVEKEPLPKVLTYVSGAPTGNIDATDPEPFTLTVNTNRPNWTVVAFEGEQGDQAVPVDVIMGEKVGTPSPYDPAVPSMAPVTVGNNAGLQRRVSLFLTTLEEPDDKIWLATVTQERYINFQLTYVDGMPAADIIATNPPALTIKATTNQPGWKVKAFVGEENNMTLELPLTLGAKTGTPNLDNAPVECTVPVTVPNNTGITRRLSFYLTSDEKPRTQIFIGTVNQLNPPFTFVENDGWAGSNIYWDGTKLTFDDMGVKTNEKNIGVQFKWGSLVAISPKNVGVYPNEWDPSLILFAPGDKNLNGDPWSASSSKCVDIPQLLGILAKDESRHLLLEGHNPERNVGDICKYMSDNGLAPASPKGWRLPTATEMKKVSPSMDVTWDLSAPITDADAGGTTQVNGLRPQSGPAVGVFFPYSGRRGKTGSIATTGNYGDKCYIWSATPFNATYAYAIYAYQQNTFIAVNNYPSYYGKAVRCVRNK